MGDPTIFLGFDFYGAGNVGDDLMLQGFLEALGRSFPIDLVCALPANRISSQRKRFSQIRWFSLGEDERRRAIEDSECWIGVGGTPFQATSGRWLLDRIKSDFDAGGGRRKWMLGIGCETEVLKERELASWIGRGVDHIWTRDQYSHDLLVGDLGVDPEKVSIGGDLAHIALRSIFPETPAHPEREGNVGIVFYEDRRNPQNLTAMRNFAKHTLKKQCLTFIANDVRGDGFERTLYKRMFPGPFSFIGRRPGFFAPDYEGEQVGDLVKHFASFDVIMSSRYHALLAAAWAGCRVVALDRSSKIRYLATELDIPLVASPFTEEALRFGLSNARAVSRKELGRKAEVAEGSVRALCDVLGRQHGGG